MTLEERRKRHTEYCLRRIRQRTEAFRSLAPLLEQHRNCNRCGKPFMMTAYRLATNAKRCSACISNRSTNRHLYKHRHPERNAAHQTVYKALKAGRLVKMPCARCGNPQSEAHHADYAKHFDVTWLCRDCHEAEHHPVER